MREVLANQKRGNILNEDRLHNLAKQRESFKVAPSCALSYDERFFIIFFFRDGHETLQRTTDYFLALA